MRWLGCVGGDGQPEQSAVFHRADRGLRQATFRGSALSIAALTQVLVLPARAGSKSVVRSPQYVKELVPRPGSFDGNWGPIMKNGGYRFRNFPGNPRTSASVSSWQLHSAGYGPGSGVVSASSHSLTFTSLRLLEPRDIRRKSQTRGKNKGQQESERDGNRTWLSHLRLTTARPDREDNFPLYQEPSRRAESLTEVSASHSRRANVRNSAVIRRQ